MGALGALAKGGVRTNIWAAGEILPLAMEV
mgnify:CR=1 FL=1